MKMGKIEARERGVGVFDSTKGAARNGEAREKSVEKEKEETRQNCRSTVTLIGGALDIVSSRSDSNGNFPFVRAEAGGGRCPTVVLVLWVGPAVRFFTPWDGGLSPASPPSSPPCRSTALSRLVEHLMPKKKRCRTLSTYPVGRLLGGVNFGGKSPNRDGGILVPFLSIDTTRLRTLGEGLYLGRGV